jgi:predicted DNA-binding transcriptional regulator AlpA
MATGIISAAQAVPGGYNPGTATWGVGTLPRDENELLTEDELSAELKISPRTLQRWRRQGRGPRWIRVGKAPRYRRGDVDAWLEEHAADG